ncbi:MAG: RNA polymerase subunit sigma-24, partial [Phototrophicales bacterium]
MDDEATLINRLRQRDPQAFATFFETYADRVYRLAYGIVGSETDAEEVVQATFISALEAIERFEHHARLGTWLYRIAYNHALMILRRRRPEETLPDDDGALPLPSALKDWSVLPEERLLSREAQEMLRKAIMELPTTLRAAFICRDIEGLSTADCAQIIGISEGALK